MNIHSWKQGERRGKADDETSLRGRLRPPSPPTLPYREGGLPRRGDRGVALAEA